MPVCYNHASMMICKKIISTITAAAAAVALFTVSVPVALAGSDNASRKAITSSRSFPKMNTARKDLLKETVSVSSDDSESWGGVESLNVPETKSTAEKKAEEEAKKAYMSSTKSMTGHLLGAAGAIEALFSVKTITDGIIPPTINLLEPDPECDLDYVPNAGRAQAMTYALSNSLGFGGHNACIALRRWEG